MAPKPSEPEAKTVKDCLIEIVRIVHGSLQSKEVLAKQIKQDCGVSRKLIDSFMKDNVTRKKADGDTKVRQLIDLAKVQEPPFLADELIISAMDEVLKERIAASLQAAAKTEPD